MATDLKAATPDTSFAWGTAGLFGADSQASASPSYYNASDVRAALLALANTWTATQTITPAVNTNALAVTGYSLTGSNASSMLDLTGTWNTSGAPSFIKISLTNTASDATSLFFECRAGGVSRVQIPANRGAIMFPESSVVSLPSTGIGNWAGTLGFFGPSGLLQATLSATAWNFSTSVLLQWNADTTLSRESADFLGSPGSLRVMNATAIPAGGTAGAGYKFSSTANFGVFFGSGAPSLAAAKGSLYLRSDGSGIADRVYVNTDGSTTWTNLVTAA